VSIVGRGKEVHQDKAGYFYSEEEQEEDSLDAALPGMEAESVEFVVDSLVIFAKRVL